MMSSKAERFLSRGFMLALVAFLLPIAAFAQDGGRGRGKRSDVFVNGHDARDGRWDKGKGRENRDRDRDRNDEDWRRRNDDRNRRGGNWDPYGHNGGYGNYGGYGNSQMRQTALNAGYNKGIQDGRKDRSRGERFDYTDEGSYQNATTDYSSRFGDRETYRQYFRQGFVNGYRDGYRGY